MPVYIYKESFREPFKRWGFLFCLFSYIYFVCTLLWYASNLLSKFTFFLTERVTGKAMSLGADATISRLHKLNIVAQTKITYSQKELQQLMYNYLMSHGKNGILHLKLCTSKEDLLGGVFQMGVIPLRTIAVIIFCQQMALLQIQSQLNGGKVFDKTRTWCLCQDVRVMQQIQRKHLWCTQ